MRYTKDDVLKLKGLVKEINDLLAEKFACNHIVAVSYTHLTLPTSDLV